MKKNEKRDNSLYGIVYPCDMSIIKGKLEVLKVGIKEIYSQDNPDHLIKICFDYSKIKKRDVYKLLIDAIKLPNGIRCSERRLALILAVFTNITGNPVCSKRINAIQRSFKRYKKIYK